MPLVFPSEAEVPETKRHLKLRTLLYELLDLDDLHRDVRSTVLPGLPTARVSELVRFEPDAPERPLRVWDLVEQDLVERELTGLAARSRCLPGYWSVREEPELGLALRLSHDELSTQPYPTPAEANAERVRQLGAELARRG